MAVFLPRNTRMLIERMRKVLAALWQLQSDVRTPIPFRLFQHLGCQICCVSANLRLWHLKDAHLYCKPLSPVDGDVAAQRCFRDRIVITIIDEYRWLVHQQQFCVSVTHAQV